MTSSRSLPSSLKGKMARTRKVGLSTIQNRRIGRLAGALAGHGAVELADFAVEIPEMADPRKAFGGPLLIPVGGIGADTEKRDAGGRRRGRASARRWPPGPPALPRRPRCRRSRAQRSGRRPCRTRSPDCSCSSAGTTAPGRRPLRCAVGRGRRNGHTHQMISRQRW